MNRSQLDFDIINKLKSQLSETCNRRNYIAMIVDRNGNVVSTGNTGAPNGATQCVDIGQECYRVTNKIPSGTCYEKCRSVHAEMNALISVSPKESDGGTMYLYGRDYETGKDIDARPCSLCARMIMNSNLKNLVCHNADGSLSDYEIGELTEFLGY